MSDMGPEEARERFIEGLKKAASRAREIAVHTKNPVWKHIALTLDNIRTSGAKLFGMTALSRFEVLAMLDEREKKLASEPSNTVQ